MSDGGEWRLLAPARCLAVSLCPSVPRRRNRAALGAGALQQWPRQVRGRPPAVLHRHPAAAVAGQVAVRLPEVLAEHAVQQIEGGGVHQRQPLAVPVLSVLRRAQDPQHRRRQPAQTEAQPDGGVGARQLHVPGQRARASAVAGAALQMARASPGKHIEGASNQGHGTNDASQRQRHLLGADQQLDGEGGAAQRPDQQQTSGHGAAGDQSAVQPPVAEADVRLGGHTEQGEETDTAAQFHQVFVDPLYLPDAYTAPLHGTLGAIGRQPYI